MQQIRGGCFLDLPLLAELVEEALDCCNDRSSDSRVRPSSTPQKPFKILVPLQAFWACHAILYYTAFQSVHRWALQAHGLAVEGKRHVCGTASHEGPALARFQRRMSPACVELTYMFDGDHNGAVYFLGSNHRQQDFVNPVLSGHIKVSVLS